MTTPKRSEAVAPVAWVERTSEGYTRMWSGDLSLWANRPADPEPLYSAETIDALQGEVSRLRAREKELSAFVLALWDEYTSAAEYMGEGCLGVDPYRKSQLDALNLEPPTDGR